MGMAHPSCPHRGEGGEDERKCGSRVVSSKEKPHPRAAPCTQRRWLTLSAESPLREDSGVRGRARRNWTPLPHTALTKAGRADDLKSKLGSV